METNHTPGPWAVGPAGVIGERAFYVPGEPVQVLGYCTRDNALANARLIAAAPDLLAALRAAVGYLEDNRPQGRIRDIFAQLNQYENGVMVPARAAIAKATESPS